MDQITGSFGINFEKIRAKFFISCDKQIGICMPLISVGDFDTRLFFKIAIEAIWIGSDLLMCRLHIFTFFGFWAVIIIDNKLDHLFSCFGTWWLNICISDFTCVILLTIIEAPSHCYNRVGGGGEELTFTFTIGQN